MLSKFKLDRAQDKFECFFLRKSHWPFCDYDVENECGLLNRLVTWTRWGDCWIFVVLVELMIS